jgi:hypothetical protein
MRPAKGVVLSYVGGDNTWCPSAGGSQSRSFSIEVLCSGTLGTTAAFNDLSVVEVSPCNYRMQVLSLAGCPLPCVTGSSQCSGRGMCGYDTDSKRTHCFCNSGAAGATCGDNPNAVKTMSAEGVILIIVCIALAGVLGGVAYMFVRLRKLQVDPSAYGQLEGKYNELGVRFHWKVSARAKQQHPTPI